MLIILDGDESYSHFELYVRLGSLPTTVDYDYLENIAGTDQIVLINTTQTGTYYIMVRSLFGGGAYRLQATQRTMFMPAVRK